MRSSPNAWLHVNNISSRYIRASRHTPIITDFADDNMMAHCYTLLLAQGVCTGVAMLCAICQINEQLHEIYAFSALIKFTK